MTTLWEVAQTIRAEIASAQAGAGADQAAAVSAQGQVPDSATLARGGIHHPRRRPSISVSALLLRGEVITPGLP